MYPGQNVSPLDPLETLGRLHFLSVIRCDDRAIDELTEDVKERGFAAAFFGGFQADVGADVSELEGVSMEGPQGESLSTPLWQDDMAGDEPGQVLQEKAAGDGGFPGGDFPGSEDRGLVGFGRQDGTDTDTLTKTGISDRCRPPRERWGSVSFAGCPCL
jgi:hypothetical protein